MPYMWALTAQPFRNSLQRVSGVWADAGACVDRILSIPDWLGATHLAPIPSYLEPLFGLFSDNNMMTEDGISGEAPMSTGLTRFTPPPSPCAHPRILVQLPDQVGL